MTPFESNLLHANSYLATFIYYQVANALTRGKWEAHIDEYALHLAAGASNTVSHKML